TSTDTRPPATEQASVQSAPPNAAAALGIPPAAYGAQPGQSPVHVVVITPAMLGLRDADERLWRADRGCTPQLDAPSTSAAHRSNETFVSR
ncbi:MAG: hypothetical protein ABIS29_04355, partial [Vicinamibacterales bacterium]